MPKVKTAPKRVVETYKEKLHKGYASYWERLKDNHKREADLWMKALPDAVMREANDGNTTAEVNVGSLEDIVRTRATAWAKENGLEISFSEGIAYVSGWAE